MVAKQQSDKADAMLSDSRLKPAYTQTHTATASFLDNSHGNSLALRAALISHALRLHYTMRKFRSSSKVF
jgi:hypothetical protein